MTKLIGIALVCASVAISAETSSFAIRNARIVTVSGPVIEKGAVVIRGGLIESVGANVNIPADAWVIEGDGLTVYPGLIDALSTLWVDMQQNAASLSRSLRLLDNEAEEPEGASFTVEKGAVEFRNLTFGYKPERPVLHAVSFRIEPGRKTAIVGPSGAGKTTTVDLLLKLFEPWSGSIVVDGQVLANASPSDVRRHIGMVLADGMVFRGTLAENIRYGCDDATDAQLLGAAAAAGLDHTLERLPNGLHTEVGEGGIGLSVGERQRVQIARVLVNTPKILVLDEATANLDFATEAEIKHTIDQVRRSNTVIVIAHRFSMVEDADHVIVLEDGRVTAQGPPAELIASGGWFAEFASAEAEETEESSEEAVDEGEDEEEDDLSGTDDEEGDG